jgi:hypothetical protein
MSEPRNEPIFGRRPTLKATGAIFVVAVVLFFVGNAMFGSAGSSNEAPLAYFAILAGLGLMMVSLFMLLLWALNRARGA